MDSLKVHPVQQTPDRVLECAQRLVEHADFKLGGILSADSKARDIPSGAVSQVKSRHLAALRDALAHTPVQPKQEPDAIDCQRSIAVVREPIGYLHAVEGTFYPTPKFHAHKKKFHAEHKYDTPVFTHASDAQEPDWTQSETLATELWKSPLHDLQSRLLMADGAIAFRDKVIANLRSQLAEATKN